MTKQNQIEIPKYVLEGNQNIPASLKIVLDYFRDFGNKNYQVCLVGEKESVAKDLKERSGYQDKYPFIHLDNKSLNDNYPFLPVSVKNSIRRINKLISNPETQFNTTILGIHTLGLLPIDEKKPLNDLGYGTTTWNSLNVFFQKCQLVKKCQECSNITSQNECDINGPRCLWKGGKCIG